ncbi:hypothetical protein SARC_00021 [Sphaeroforma arctica JP610]|uniref:Uncharacterized protein n=1 Tax=Sphaeroforma arctica JP610 TaxID=667725 RepID=A0A0L0GHQ7_9EUKA|nr:hypothetical protein SARC_00021 [Sphaeroforma arctica JP610]KNC87888.1 hypothetical protein SARC_00021 [Sphaeroforma arctica JP610]|eukprot:XP_014161790.1 hypothetical protein SARC_00021 [Sphaeroforma arctica JP610]
MTRSGVIGAVAHPSEKAVRRAKEVLGESLRHAKAWPGRPATGPSEGSLGAMAETWLGKADKSARGGLLGVMYIRIMSAKSPVLTRCERGGAEVVDKQLSDGAMDIDTPLELNLDAAGEANITDGLTKVC